MNRLPHRRMHRPALAALAAALTLAALPAQAQTLAMPRALVFTETGHPLSLLPGRNDGLGISSFSIGQIAYSANGSRWVLSAVGTSVPGLTSPTLVLSGKPQGLRTASVQNEPLAGLGLAWSSTPNSLAINDSGDFAFGSQVTGGSASNRVFIAGYRSATGAYEVVARQNDLIPGLQLSVPGATGERYGSALSISSVLADGRRALVAENTSGPLASAVDEFLLIDGNPVQVLAQAGVLVPGGQSGGAVAVMGNLERRAGVSADGSRWLAFGQLTGGGNPDVLVVNGQVVLQEGVPVPGLPGDVFVPSTALHPGGDWTARGTSSAGVRYLIVNGVLRVMQGALVPRLPQLGVVQRIDLAAMNVRGDLAYAVTTESGRPWIVVERADGSQPFVAVSDQTVLDVGGSVRGTLYYGGTLNSDLGLGFGANQLWFMTRARDDFGLNVADGLFYMRLGHTAK